MQAYGMAGWRVGHLAFKDRGRLAAQLSKVQPFSPSMVTSIIGLVHINGQLKVHPNDIATKRVVCSGQLHIIELCSSACIVSHCLLHSLKNMKHILQ